MAAHVPEKLIERLKKLGLDESIYETRSRKCVLSRERLNMEKVPWYEHAYYIGDDFDARNHLVFDPVSIVPCIALAPEKDDRILDMCAAPGTKTYILSFITENEARITANDINSYRIRRLAFNISKFHISAEIKNTSGRKIDETFDKILVDAPCSGEGMINKKEKIFDAWSENRIKMMSKKQKKLVDHAFNILEKGGALVYSTCTFAPEENEAVVDFLLSRHEDAEMCEINASIKHSPGVKSWNRKEFDPRVAKCMRIYPQQNNTAGFFVAKIKKM